MKIFAGSYNQSTDSAGIHVGHLEKQSGVMDYRTSLPAGMNPSWIEWDELNSILFCVNETNSPNGGVTALHFSDDGSLKSYTQAIRGSDPCHLAYDRSNRILFTADYSSGTVSKVLLDERLIPVDSTVFASHTGSGPVSGRQDSAHVHAVYKRPEGLWCCDLGIDTLRLYEPRTAEILAEIRTPRGTGPRMILWSAPDFFYVVAELSNSILAYQLCQDRWSLVEQWSTLDPQGDKTNTASCAVLDTQRRVIYVANRGQDNIAVFRILSNGELKPDGNVKLKVQCPRHFILTLDGNYLIAAGQDCGRLEVFSIDENAQLLSRALYSGYGHPACLVALSEETVKFK